METKKQELIVVKQLPIIEENLKTLSVVIDEKVAKAMALEVNDNTVKEVKKVRAELNKEFDNLEAQRKFVKDKIEEPYNAFLDIYKKYVSKKYEQADIDLRNKINSVEKKQKELKEKEVKDYYLEYSASKNLEWLDKYYNLVNINVTITASMKSLKESVTTFVDRVENDLKLIDTQENKNEIMVEYQKDLNVSRAITEVNDRHKQLEEIEKKNIQKEEIEKIENAKIEAVEEIVKPAEEIKEEKVFELTFKVYGTKEQLTNLKRFLESGGYKYE